METIKTSWQDTQSLMHNARKNTMSNNLVKENTSHMHEIT